MSLKGGRSHPACCLGKCPYSPTRTNKREPSGPGATRHRHRATNQTALAGFDLVELGARCITSQAFTDEEHENGLAYASLGLLSFGPSKELNIVWERLQPETQERLDKRLLVRTDYNNHHQVFNIAKAVGRFSLGLSKKDETATLIDKFIERIKQHSTGGFCDDAVGTRRV